MATQRSMTEEEQDKFVEVSNSFWEKLAALAAEHIAQMPVEVEDSVVERLQEMCSIYGSSYDKLLPALRAKA